MIGFDYFRTIPERFLPKTAQTALKALEQGLAPPEAWLHLGTSVKPLDEEPFDLEELDRVLAREELDIESCLILRNIFTRLTRSPDPEAALLAAESINILENRYIRRIDALKKELEGKSASASALILRRLAALLHELAQLSPSSIRNFYLREAYSTLSELSRMGRLAREDVARVIRVLLDLRLHEQAARVLARLREEEKPFFQMLAAELEFCRRNYTEARRLLEQLPEGSGPEAEQLRAFWQEL